MKTYFQSEKPACLQATQGYKLIGVLYISQHGRPRTLSYQWVSQSPTEILRGIYTYSTPGVSVVCYVTVCQPAASNS